MTACGGKRQGMVARPNNPVDHHDSEGEAFAKARELQRRLYVSAKRDRSRRFHALYDRIWRSDPGGPGLEAWERTLPGCVRAAREDHR